jgi:hypothetical protein
MIFFKKKPQLHSKKKETPKTLPFSSCVHLLTEGEEVLGFFDFFDLHDFRGEIWIRVAVETSSDVESHATDGVIWNA